MPNTPERDRDRLIKALDERAKKVKTAERWFDGDHPVPDPPMGTLASVDREARLAFQSMARRAVMNLTPPIVNQPARKCIINGIRFGENAQSSDPAAWRIWQRNQMDADHALTNFEALKVGSAPVLVWRNDAGLAEITVEDPAQAIVAYEPGSRRKRSAALKRWVDEDGHAYCTLYRPDGLYKWVSGTSVDSQSFVPWMSGGSQWKIRQPVGEQWPLPNPMGTVPMVEVRANAGIKARTYGGGVPEFSCILTTQQRLNNHMMKLLITEDNQAFRQRWATDWDYPTREDGTPDTDQMLRFSAANMAVFNSDEEGTPVHVGEFAQADFRPFIDVIGMEIKLIASDTDTPPYAFLIGDMINVASDTLARIEAGFTSKVIGHTNQFGEAWEEIIRLALLAENDPRSADDALSVSWVEPESRTATEQTVVSAAYQAAGAPDEAVFAALPDVDQQEAHRWVVQKAAEELLNPIPVP